MIIKRKTVFMLIYIGIIAAMLFTFFYVQKRYGHKSSKKRSEKTITVPNGIAEKSVFTLKTESDEISG